LRERIKCFFDDSVFGGGGYGGGGGGGGGGGAGGCGGGAGGGDGRSFSGDGGFVVVLVSSGGPAVYGTVKGITAVVGNFARMSHFQLISVLK